MGIKLNADISGLRPADFLDKPAIVEILSEPELMNTGRDFKQYQIRVRVQGELNEQMINFLFERQLSPIARAYGGEDEELKNWIGKHLNIKAVNGEPGKDGKVFANFEFTPVEEDIVIEST